MTQANTRPSAIAHAFQSLAAELDRQPEAEHAAYLARVTMILAQELGDQRLFAEVLERARGSQ